MKYVSLPAPLAATLMLLSIAYASAQYQLELPQIDLSEPGTDSGKLVSPGGARRDPWVVVRPPAVNPQEAKHPTAPQKLLTPFEVCSKAQSREEAIQTCTDVAVDETQPVARRTEAYLIRSRAYVAQGQTIPAIADLTAALELSPNSALAFRQRASLWLQERNYDLAIKDYTTAISVAPESSLETLIARGVAFRSKKDFKRSLVDFDRVVAAKSRSTYALALYERALTKEAFQDADGALSDLRLALAADPGLALAHYATGNILFKSRDLDGAIRSYDEAMRINPELEYYVANARGIAQQQQGDCRGAIDNFSKALKLNPRSAVILRNRANCLLRVGRPEEAVVDFTRALYSAPDTADLFAERSVAYLQMADYATAQRDIAEAIKRDENNATALRNSARLKALRKNLKGALADFDTAQIAQPSPETASEKIWLFIAAGDDAGALREIEAALARNSRDPDGLFARGYLNLKARKNAQASHEIAEAIKLDPEITSRIAFLGLKY